MAPPTASAATTQAADTFQRTLASGWGSADTGGAWTLCSTCSSLYSVGSGAGWVTLAAAKGTEAALRDYASTNTELAVVASVDRVADGGGSYISVIVRGTRADGYLGSLSLKPTGAVALSIERTAASATTTLVSGSLPTGTFTAGAKLSIRMQAVGTGPTALRLKVWKAGAAEPAGWTLSTTDATSALQKAGSFSLWTYLSRTATNGPARFSFDDVAVGAPPSDGGGTTTTPPPTTTTPPPITTTPPPTTTTTGARLPVSYSLSTLTGTIRYVSPAGSDSTGTGSLAAPYRTLTKAEAVSANGDSIVLRGGTYPIASNTTYVDRSGLTIIAYPGETPVFDGSLPAPTATTAEGVLRHFSYQPIPAGLPDGIPLGNLPAATFSGSSPTGMTAERGWRCLSGSTYATPAPSTADPDGCPGTAILITGHYPDQVWLDGVALQQVADKARVKAGTFWLSRTSATDAAPAVTSLYLHSTDAADMSKVRVSSSKGTFLAFAADKTRLIGVRIQRHSPGGSHYAVAVGGAVDDFVMRDVVLDSNHGINIKVAGGDNSDGSRLVRRPTFERISVTRSTFMGFGVINTDDMALVNSQFRWLNTQQEFRRGPVSGAMKAGKTSRMVVTDSLFQDVWGQTLWWDQSNYDVTVARNRFVNNSHSSVFFEIGHGLTLVNNHIQGPAVGPGEEGHSTVRIAGSSGVRIVNNTILGGPIGLGIFADPRSKRYDSNGDGAPDRYCSEHTVRYGLGGDAKAACNSPYPSDFNRSHPGAYAPSGVNQTPGMNWMPEISMVINNVIANQAPAMASGWTPCGGRTPLCVYGYLNSPKIDVGLRTIFPSGSVIDGNVYQTSGTQIAWLNSPGSLASTGTFRAADLAALKGPSGFGSAYYGKSVEAHGRSGTGYVNSDGTPTSALTAIAGQAAPVPTDAKINRYVPAGSRSFGYLG
jgi:hypothetical protein